MRMTRTLISIAAAIAGSSVTAQAASLPFARSNEGSCQKTTVAILYVCPLAYTAICQVNVWLFGDLTS